MKKRSFSAFISYRRSDAEASGGYGRELLDEHLVGALRELGATSVFLDAKKIEYGEDYRNRIHHEIADCDVFIAVIGRGWLDALRTRVENAELDMVQVEIRTALQLEKRIVPILVNDAQMPAISDLPSEIAEFHFQHALSARSDTRSSELVDKLNPIVQSLRHRLKGGWDIAYTFCSLLAYALVAIVPNAVGLFEYGLDAWQGMATIWSGLFIWPITFLPFALLSLARPFKTLIEGVLNATSVFQSFTYLTPIFFGLLVACLALAIEIFSAHQVPWTVSPRFEASLVSTAGTGAATHCRTHAPPFTDPRLSAVENYDPDNSLRDTLIAHDRPIPFWLDNKCWPGVFFYLTSPTALADPNYLENRRPIQQRFLSVLHTDSMSQHRVQWSNTFWAYLASFTILILLGSVGVSMAVFFVMAQLKRRREETELKLPSEDAYLCLTYAFVSLMFWVPFRMVTNAFKNRYYCEDLSACTVTLSHYLNDIIIGLVFFLGYTFMAAGLLFKYGRIGLGILGLVFVVGISVAAYGVIEFADQFMELTPDWRIYVGVSIPSVLVLLALWYQFDPAMVRFNDFRRQFRSATSSRVQ